MIDIVALFSYTENVDLFLIEMKRRGFGDSNLLVVPLKKADYPLTIEAVSRGGRTHWDMAFFTGTICMLLGCIYGFVLAFGPVLWGLFGLIFGMIFGYFLQWCYEKWKGNRKKTMQKSFIVIMVRCPKTQENEIHSVLYKHHAYALGKV
ncbi:hypothetical protein [Paenibacillus turpanensis]|uniref:hypothetical protein n=1 Tax=Paenibacillus turpanensis TaxID=2689078 RepID=UPI001409BFEE|nr:hypothetical protein [Paenibacillus turpanensis]